MGGKELQSGAILILFGDIGTYFDLALKSASS